MLLVDVVVVVVAGEPLMTMPLKALMAAGGIVVEPATVVPLGWPDEFPPASADGAHKPAATSNSGRVAMRIARAISCLRVFMMVQPVIASITSES